MVDERSTRTFISLVLFSACGVLVFSVLFIIVKRQIRRVTLKTKREPHARVGTGAPKILKDEIDRRLLRTAKIVHEPKLLSEGSANQIRSTENFEELPHLYRTSAVNCVSSLVDQLKKSKFPAKVASEDLETYFLSINLASIFELMRDGRGFIDRLCVLHRHACHNPKKFSKEHYNQVLQLVTELTHAVNGVERCARESSGANYFDIATDTMLEGNGRKLESQSRFFDKLPFKKWTTSLFGGSRLNDYQAVASSIESIEQVPAAAVTATTGL